jgi:hypothetical protein
VTTPPPTATLDFAVVDPFIFPQRFEAAGSAFGHQHCDHFDESSPVPSKSSENSSAPTGTGA